MSSDDTHTVFYVAADGSDAWSGQLPARNAAGSDGPFATLARARDAIRAFKQVGSLPAGRVTVFVRAGDYVLDSTFALSPQDSGTAEAPICYRAYESERARLLGGRAVTNFRPVTDPVILARLDEPAREHVLAADLKALGITDFGRFQSRGLGRPTVPAHMELFFNGKPMTVARWPNDDFARIAGYPEEGQHDDEHGHMIGGLDYGFHYDGDRPRRWQSMDNVWLHGYWAWDWANSYEEVESIDAEQRLIKTKPPHGSWGYRTGNRFYFLNVLEELDSPGEYYVDRSTGVLYFWPPDGAGNDGTLHNGARPDAAGALREAPLRHDALVSILETPLVHFDRASYVTLRGMVLEAGRGMGVQIDGGDHVQVSNCTLRNMGIHAVCIEGGHDHTVSGCDISETGDGGIFITGGDRKTLTPCNHSAHNNHIYRLSRWSRCYTPAIHASGVGIRMTHNLIHDLPHSGIIFWGNEMLIEYNEIHHVTLESADAGAIYTGRDFTARGDVIRYNYIHDTGGYDWGTMGVYLDDCVSGETIYGNLFVRVQRGTFIGGGRDNLVENNVFVDCKPAVWVDARGLDKRVVWHNMIYKTMRERLVAMDHHRPPYSERYPALAQLDRYYAGDDGIPPEGNVIIRNICIGGAWLESSWHTDAATYVTVADNLVGADPHFVDAARDDYRLCADSPALRLGFRPLPLEQIGLIRE